MRELKVRAWNAPKKKMFSSEEMARDQMALLPNGYFANINSTSVKLTRIFTHEEMLPLLYTTLKDKSSKEIYEGDIVKVHIFTQELGENMGVCEGEKEFIALVEFNSDGVSLNNGKDNSGPIWSYYGMHEESFEIIGNKFENPELLEE